jgi:hypothetical protein
MKSKYNAMIAKIQTEFEAKLKDQQEAMNRIRDEMSNMKVPRFQMSLTHPATL